MDDANDLSQSEDSTIDDSDTSSVASNEDTTQQVKWLYLAQSLKNYQIKSPEELAAILQQWNDLENECTDGVVNLDRYIHEITLLREVVFFHYAVYAVKIKNLPSTVNLGQFSAQQLHSYNQALEHEQKAGKATWELYEVQKKVDRCQNALEKFIAFREEHFIIKDLEQQRLDQGKDAIAVGRLECRRTGLVLMEARQKMLRLSEEID
ncbi:hypothetical protein KCU65_g9518, partial [Aureobasidium melanogenum]